MDSILKTYTILPIVSVRNKLVEVKDFPLQTIELQIKDKHWRQKKLYDDIEHTVKSFILNEIIPFNEMRSFRNIKHHMIEFHTRFGATAADGKYVTSTNLMYMRDYDYSFITLPSPLKKVKMYFLYIIEDCEMDLWNTYFLNTSMSNVSIC